MILESTSASEPGKSLYALTNWKNAVRGANLDTVKVEWEIRNETPAYPGDHPCGTRITLKNPRSRWDAEALEGLGDEVWRLRSPFKRSPRRRERRRPEDFDIEIIAPTIAGARDAFDKKMRTLFSNWKARIRGNLDRGRLEGKASISVEFRSDYPAGSDEAAFHEIVQLPIRRGNLTKTFIDRTSFEILVFKTEGRQPGGITVGELRSYLAEFGNVALYDAGFRLPYYGSGRDAAGQDWLSIALDQGRRLNASELLPDRLRTQNKYMQDLPAPGRIFGAVEVDTNHERAVASKSRAQPGEWLQIQPGRDRLHDNHAFGQLRDLVRFSLDFYANRFRVRAVQDAEKMRAREPPSRKFQRALNVLDRNKPELPATTYQEIRREIVDARRATRAEEEVLDQRAALLAPLATAGMAALALSHELSREAGFLDRVVRQLRQLAKSRNIVELTPIAGEFEKAKNRLISLQELFAPLLSDNDKTAIERLRVRAVAEQTVSSMRILMPRVSFDLSGTPSDLRFPLGSFAEWNALLQNVLSNAWNAMLDAEEREISFRGGRDRRGGEWLLVSDTGKGLGIPLSEAHKLFEPFERHLVISDEKRSIAIGGQGLGLAIVRMIARRRSANVTFVEPDPGFSTTFEISWRGATK